MKQEIRIKIGTIILRNDKILMIKEKFWSGSAHFWNIGTGSWERSDGGIANAAKREAKEEMGLDIKIKGLHKVVVIEREEKTKIYFFFVAESFSEEVILESKEQQEELGEEIIEYKWFDRDGILETPDKEFVTTTIAKVIKDYIKDPKLISADIVEHINSEFSN